MAKRQFEVIADYLEIAEGYRERIIYPKRAVSVAVPIPRDDGTVEVFHGYRVQHHLWSVLPRRERGFRPI